MAAALAAGCGAVRLPPPPVPAKVLPTVDPPPPPARGEGQIALDAVDGRAEVTEVGDTVSIAAGAYGAGGSAAMFGGMVDERPVCATPCIADLPFGTHRLHLSLTDANGDVRSIVDTVNVGPQPHAYRAALGVERTHAGLQYGGLLLGALGASTLIVGGIMAAVPSTPATYDPSGSPAPSSGMSTGTGVIIGIGAVALVAGTIMMIEGRPEEQEGTGVEWAVPGTPAPSPAPASPAATTYSASATP